MNPSDEVAGLPAEPITVDDLRHKALAVRDTARRETRELLVSNQTRIVIAAAVAGAVVLSVAYFLGTMAGRRECREERR